MRPAANAAAFLAFLAIAIPALVSLLPTVLGTPSRLALAPRFLNTTNLEACKALQAAIDAKAKPDSTVEYVGGPAYIASITRYMSSSVTLPTCVFVPTNAQDLASAVKLIGQRRISFAVSSGRHASNNGFSSTTGIEISLKGFQHVTLSQDKTSVDIGSGNIWDNVYAALEGSGYNIVSGALGDRGCSTMLTASLPVTRWGDV